MAHSTGKATAAELQQLWRNNHPVSGNATKVVSPLLTRRSTIRDTSTFLSQKGSQCHHITQPSTTRSPSLPILLSRSHKIRENYPFPCLPLQLKVHSNIIANELPDEAAFLFPMATTRSSRTHKLQINGNISSAAAGACAECVIRVSIVRGSSSCKRLQFDTSRKQYLHYMAIFP